MARKVFLKKDEGENPLTYRFQVCWRIVDENGKDVILPWFYGRSARKDAVEFCKHAGWEFSYWENK